MKINIDMEILQKYLTPRVLIQTNDAQFGNQLSEHITNFAESDKKLAIKKEDSYFFIDTENIIYLEVFQKDLTIYTDEGEITSRTSLGEAMERLDLSRFIQISKSASVNIGKIKRMEVAFSGNYYAFLKNGMKITVSRRFVRCLKQKLGI